MSRCARCRGVTPHARSRSMHRRPARTSSSSERTRTTGGAPLSTVWPSLPSGSTAGRRRGSCHRDPVESSSSVSRRSRSSSAVSWRAVCWRSASSGWRWPDGADREQSWRRPPGAARPARSRPSGSSPWGASSGRSRSRSQSWRDGCRPGGGSSRSGVPRPRCGSAGLPRTPGQRAARTGTRSQAGWRCCSSRWPWSEGAGPDVR